MNMRHSTLFSACTWILMQGTVWMLPAATPLRFEVASVKPADPNDKGNSSSRDAGEGLDIRNVPVRNLITLAVTYAQMQQTNRTIELFDQALTSPNLKYADAATIASYYSQFSNMPKLEQALAKLAELAPTEPEPHYDLAALQAYRGETGYALTNLKTALMLNIARLKTNPAARDLLQQARGDAHLNSLRALPEFQKLVPPQ